MSQVILGDCVEELKKLPENSVDSIVTDPPYGLKFMGKEFDDLGEGAQQREWHKAWALEALRVLKPGGHLITFGGTRTYHHLATAVEEAGFEIRDQIQWLYGSGFPKSLNVGKAIDKAKGKKRKILKTEDNRSKYDNAERSSKKNTKNYLSSSQISGASNVVEITAPATEEAARWEGWGTALKPANEPCVLARKPFKGTVAENVQEWGTGAMNIDGCRVEGKWGGSSKRTNSPETKQVYGTYNKVETQQHKEGRWPANVILDEEAGELLDEQSGTIKTGNAGKEKSGDGGCFGGGRHTKANHYGDTGGASRFFYCPKAGKKERNAGLEGFEKKEAKTTQGLNSPEMRKERGRTARETTRANHHPTVKPVKLMAYLIRLVTPPGGTVLDPFLGSGSTALAAIEEGFSFIGIEKDPEYVEIARARIKHWEEEAAAKEEE